jgi:hypothetical protein
MSLEQREPVVRPDVVSHIFKTAELGPVRMNDPRHGALHGASLETLRIILRQGSLPGTGKGMNDEYYEIGDVSINPTEQLLPLARRIGTEFMVTQIIKYPDRLLSDSIGYAQMCAQEHFFLDTLGLPFEDAQCREEVFELFSILDRENYLWFRSGDITPHVDYIVGRGIPEAQVRQTIQQALLRKGFLFGFSPSIQEDERWEILDGMEPDLKIRTFGKGLPFEFISGIEPLGPVEERFLQGLRFGSKIIVR